MVGKMVVVVIATVLTAILNLDVVTLVQMVLAINLAEFALVVEHRGRISTLETVHEVGDDSA
jgi:hypothetical protein